MEQTLKLWDTYKIPTYAACALENGDYEGLDTTDLQHIHQFEKEMAKNCPEGYEICWSYDEPYFSNTPAFGLASEVIDAKVYRIVNYDESKLTPAYIDGKDVADDFDFLHGDEYVEDVVDGETKLLFWKNGCMCCLNYTFGTNMFNIRIYNPEGNGDIEAAEDALNEACFDCCDLTERLMLKIETAGNGDLRIIYGEYYWIAEN